MAKANRKGRNDKRQGRFVRLGHEIILSDAFLSLTPNARSLLIVLISRYTKKNGSPNNGEFWLSESDAADLMGVASKKTARAAFIELSEAGFICMTKNSYFNVKVGSGRARCWRLTWEFNDEDRKPASNEWKDFAPAENSLAEKRMQRGKAAVSRYKKELSENQNAGVNFTPTAQKEQSERVNITPTDREANTKPPFVEQVKGVKYTPHIAIPEVGAFADATPLRMMALGLDPFQQAA